MEWKAYYYGFKQLYVTSPTKDALSWTDRFGFQAVTRRKSTKLRIYWDQIAISVYDGWTNRAYLIVYWAFLIEKQRLFNNILCADNIM